MQALLIAHALLVKFDNTGGEIILVEAVACDPAGCAGILEQALQERQFAGLESIC
jgi:hypothetical protein